MYDSKHTVFGHCILALTKEFWSLYVKCCEDLLALDKWDSLEFFSGQGKLVWEFFTQTGSFL